MYVLYAPDRATLEARSVLFEQYMEPLLVKLEAAERAGRIPPSLPEIPQYLQVCRWPFRKLEYSLALDALLDHLKPGDRYLDAGSGATPLAFALAARGVEADACDGEARLIEELRRLRPETIYGSSVSYQTQNLTAMSYPNATFDAISCISVLEHIPAPYDQHAIRELLRVLKPGGLLILTVDFTPAALDSQAGQLRYYTQRIASLARSGNIGEIARGIGRKVQARQAVTQGEARLARSANQCFQVEHLEQDIAPLLDGEELASRIPFSQDLRSVTAEDARRFWDLEAGLFDKQGRRDVLPAALILRKSAVAAQVEEPQLVQR